MRQQRRVRQQTSIGGATDYIVFCIVLLHIVFVMNILR